jgi:hypothetical protein
MTPVRGKIANFKAQTEEHHCCVEQQLHQFIQPSIHGRPPEAANRWP